MWSDVIGQAELSRMHYQRLQKANEIARKHFGEHTRQEMRAPTIDDFAEEMAA